MNALQHADALMRQAYEGIEDVLKAKYENEGDYENHPLDVVLDHMKGALRELRPLLPVRAQSTDDLECSDNLLRRAFDGIADTLDRQWGAERVSHTPGPLDEALCHIADAHNCLRLVMPDPTERLPDIAEFEPVYKGSGPFDDMCFLPEELAARGVTKANWWTLSYTEGNSVVWRRGVHWGNRANGPRPYIYTCITPPADDFEARPTSTMLKTSEGTNQGPSNSGS